MSAAMWIRYKFIPPFPLDEKQFNAAKELQKFGSKKIRYLATVNKAELKGQALVFGVLYGATIIFCFFSWIISMNLPNSGAARLYNDGTYGEIAGFISLGLFYVVYKFLWEYFTANGYNIKLHRMIKKSATYSDFRKTYHYKYGK